MVAILSIGCASDSPRSVEAGAKAVSERAQEPNPDSAPDTRSIEELRAAARDLRNRQRVHEARALEEKASQLAEAQGKPKAALKLKSAKMNTPAPSSGLVIDGGDLGASGMEKPQIEEEKAARDPTPSTESPAQPTGSKQQLAHVQAEIDALSSQIPEIRESNDKFNEAAAQLEVRAAENEKLAEEMEKKASGVSTVQGTYDTYTVKSAADEAYMHELAQKHRNEAAELRRQASENRSQADAVPKKVIELQSRLNKLLTLKNDLKKNLH